MKHTLQTSIIATAFLGAASLSQAATTIATVEAALGTGNGIYMDLQSDAAGFTNQGVTGTWSNWSSSWGFASAGASTGDGGTAGGPGDTSDSSITVFGRSADDKGQTTTEIQVDYTNLLPNTTYNLWAVVLQNTNNGISHDLEWGLTSGSLTTVTGTPGFPGAVYIAGAAIGAGTQLVGTNVGQVTTDGSGAITIYYDQGLNPGSGVNENRTQFDGMLFDAVPEPSVLALFGLAGLGFLRRRRK
jgi:hypothetical protein